MGKLKIKLFLKLPVNCVKIKTRKSEFKIMVYHLVIVAAMPGMIWYVDYHTYSIILRYTQVYYT